jgi:eukaryotic-like serine/threonine-protein kinase
MTGSELGPGVEIGGYRLVREIGRGMMGVVFEARDGEDRPVALKVLMPPPLLTSEELQSLERRFLREARALSSVDHPNVVRVFGFGGDAGRLFLAMELLDGQNLRQVLIASGALVAPQAAAVMVQLCDALEAVHHAGIVHRDIKPENVVLLADGSVKLTDFGVAWVENEATLTRTGGVLGSPAYMSPEQILGRPVDRRSDLFSAAVTLYQLLADRLPFAGANLVEMAHRVAYAEPDPLPASVPYALGRAVLRGLQKSPAARYATAHQFADSIRLSLPARNAPAIPADQARTLAAAAGTATVMDIRSRCAQHRSQPAVGHCRACGRALCRHCARHERPPYYCLLHTPVTFFGISTVRLEVALVAIALLLLLLTLSPLGYAALSR